VAQAASRTVTGLCNCMPCSPLISSTRAAISLVVLACLGTVKLAGAQTPVSVQQHGPYASGSDSAAVILILGDSLSLCGFGKRLDEHFRKSPQVARATFTYMACGTNPLSWLKEKPYTTIKTHCGFWSIESVSGSLRPAEFEDVYGMRRHSSPKAYPVPKLDDLLAQLHPEVLILQTGGNLFDLFPDKKTARPERRAAALKNYITPFVASAVASTSSLRKIYWVSSPTSGRVSKSVQDFIVEEVRAYLGPLGTVIDSRNLLSYPYRHTQPDHEHFVGEDMNLWADKVFEIVRNDLSAHPVASLTPLRETANATLAAVTPMPAPAEKPRNDVLQISARLVFKSKAMQVEEFLPYRESMTAYLYDVREVLDGQYSDKQILVMHPAYIGLRKQSLRKYRIGRTYHLKLRELEGTAWSTVKRRDDSGRMDLEPYIRVEDEAKYPGESQ
jgi:hypothetical protein